MKLARLDLIAFGPFTNVSLDLSAGQHGLHIIFGPNEAGKSSTLRALRGLLFGIPERTDDSHVHANPELRIAALLHFGTGESLEFVRRKGRGNTLRGAKDDVPLDPARLAIALGGVEEATFTSRFGVTHDQIRAGGKEIDSSDGDLGQVLFAASAGIAELGRIQVALDEEARELYKPRGKQRINLSLEELNALNKSARALQLSVATWDGLQKSVADAASEEQHLRDDQHAVAARLARLERLVAAAPIVARRATLLKSLRGLGDVPRLTDDFSKRRGATQKDWEAAQRAALDADDEINRIDTEDAGLAESPELIAHAERIDSLLQNELGAFRKAMADRVDRVADLRQLEDQARTNMARLGARFRDERNILRTADRARIEELALEHARVEPALAAARSRRDDPQRMAREVERRLAVAPGARDVGELSRLRAVATELLPEEKALPRREAAVAALREQLAIDFARLSPLPANVGDVAALERLPLPDPEICEQYESRIESAARAADSARQRVADVVEALEAAESKFASLASGGSIPTTEQLAGVRAERDATWKLIREAITKAKAPSESRLADYERFAAKADDVADRLCRDADRVAVTEQARLAIEECRVERDKRAAQCKGQESKLAGLVESWRDHWRPCGFEPRTPREMRVWLAEVQRLHAAAAELRTEKSEVVALGNSVRSAIDQLSAAILKYDATSGRTAASSVSKTLSLLLKYADDVLAEAAGARQRHEKLIEERERTALELAAATDAHAKLEAALDDWRTRWAAAVDALGQDADLSPHQAQAVMRDLNDVQTLFGKAQDLRKRIADIDDYAARVLVELGQVIALAAPDLMAEGASPAAGDVSRLAAELSRRLGAARAAATKRDDLAKNRARHATRLRDARRMAEEAEKCLAELCREAGVNATDELAAAETRWAEHQRLTADRTGRDEALASHACGAALDEFAAEVSAADLAEIPTEIARLQSELTALESNRRVAHERLVLARQAAQETGWGRAAEEHARAESIRAKVREDAESFARLKLAAKVLACAIERFRQRNQDPLLARASELFVRLTCGSFSGLVVDFDGDRPVVVGLRAADKKKVRAAAMSDGACDQLYLALRLASVEEYASRHEAIPFIADDILQRFDDDRSAAALSVLAELSRRTQVILFTHHEHVLELARRRLSEGEWFEHHLGQATRSLPGPHRRPLRKPTAQRVADDLG